MTLCIRLEHEQATLELVRNGQVVDSEPFSYFRNLDEQWITHLDILLRRNSIDTVAIKDYNIVSDLGPQTTARQIVEAMVGALKS